MGEQAVAILLVHAEIRLWRLSTSLSASYCMQPRPNMPTATQYTETDGMDPTYYLEYQASRPSIGLR